MTDEDDEADADERTVQAMSSIEINVHRVVECADAVTRVRGKPRAAHTVATLHEKQKKAAKLTHQTT